MLGQDQKTSCRDFMLGQIFSGNTKMSVSCFFEDIDHLRKGEEELGRQFSIVFRCVAFHVDDASE